MNIVTGMAKKTHPFIAFSLSCSNCTIQKIVKGTIKVSLIAIDSKTRTRNRIEYLKESNFFLFSK
jgi:hypothetical protein